MIKTKQSDGYWTLGIFGGKDVTEIALHPLGLIGECDIIDTIDEKIKSLSNSKKLSTKYIYYTDLSKLHEPLEFRVQNPHYMAK